MSKIRYKFSQSPKNARNLKPKLFAGSFKISRDVNFYNSYGSFYKKSSLSSKVSVYHVHSFNNIQDLKFAYFDVKGKLKGRYQRLLKPKRMKQKNGKVTFLNGSSFQISVWGKVIDSIKNTKKVPLFAELQKVTYFKAHINYCH